VTLAEVAERGERIIDELARREVPPELFQALTDGRTAAATCSGRGSRVRGAIWPERNSAATK